MMNPNKMENHFRDQVESGVTSPVYTGDSDGATFDSQDFRCTRWTGSLRDTVWVDCDLRGASMEGDLSGAFFYRCQLTGADLPPDVEMRGCATTDLFEVPSRKLDPTVKKSLTATALSTCLFAIGICLRQNIVAFMMEGAAAGALFALFMVLVKAIPWK